MLFHKIANDESSIELADLVTLRASNTRGGTIKYGAGKPSEIVGASFPCIGPFLHTRSFGEDRILLGITKLSKNS